MDDWPGCRPNLNHSTLLTGQIEKRNKHHILYDYMRVTEVHHDMSCFIEFQAVTLEPEPTCNVCTKDILF